MKLASVGKLARSKPASWLRSLASIAALLPSLASASESLVSELEQRLSRSGVEAVNSYLNAHASSVMVALNQRTGACELDAVSLAARLSRSRNAQATRAHVESLRAAAGRCTGFVLAVALPAEIPRFCGSMAAWGVVQTARELRRRIGAIDADELLRASSRGQACRAAYLYELQNTRVVVKRSASSAVAQGR